VTADGDTVMTLTRPGATLVDVLGVEQTEHAVPASGELRLRLPAQRAMILVPRDQLRE
jgi:hypothetical protein